MSKSQTTWKMTPTTLRRLYIGTLTVVYCVWTFHAIEYWVEGNAAACGTVIGTMVIHAFFSNLLNLSRKNCKKMCELADAGHKIMVTQNKCIKELQTGRYLQDRKEKLMQQRIDQLQRALKARQDDGEGWKRK